MSPPREGSRSPHCYLCLKAAVMLPEIYNTSELIIFGAINPRLVATPRVGPVRLNFA